MKITYSLDSTDFYPYFFVVQISPTCPGYFSHEDSHMKKLRVQQPACTCTHLHLAPSLLRKCSKNDIAAFLELGPVATLM